jgi:hypothetical protein
LGLGDTRVCSLVTHAGVALVGLAGTISRLGLADALIAGAADGAKISVVATRLVGDHLGGARAVLFEAKPLEARLVEVGAVDWLGVDADSLLAGLRAVAIDPIGAKAQSGIFVDLAVAVVVDAVAGLDRWAKLLDACAPASCVAGLLADLADADARATLSGLPVGALLAVLAGVGLGVDCGVVAAVQ